MLRKADYEQDFYLDQNRKHQKVVVYGAGMALQKEQFYIPEIDYICDREKTEFQGNPVIKPKQLEMIGEPFRILFVILAKNMELYQEVCEELQQLDIDAIIYNYYDNISFDYFHIKGKRYVASPIERPIKVNIVCWDQGWILRKFADRLCENLMSLGVDVSIGVHTDPTADINHHVQFGICIPEKQDTIMVSHVDCEYWLDILKIQLQTAKLAICMSKETVDRLTMLGIPRQKLCYVSPAHDHAVKPKKYVIGITHRNHGDFRNRETTVLDIFSVLNPKFFILKIMGDGWDDIVTHMEKMGFEVEYYPMFDYQRYQEMIPELDYYMFFGNDEGSMGFLDALAAGVETIVTPQGFHMDLKDGITYPCKTVKEFAEALLELQRKRERLIKLVEPLTWENYAKKHIEIWECLLKRKPFRELYRNQHLYDDGIFSMFLDDLGYIG